MRSMNPKVIWDCPRSRSLLLFLYGYEALNRLRTRAGA
jgi:hypothetical protein